MADYQKLYALLCGAIDDVIDPLERIPLVLPYAKKTPPYTCAGGGTLY